jgi:hypothetical protein
MKSVQLIPACLIKNGADLQTAIGSCPLPFAGWRLVINLLGLFDKHVRGMYTHEILSLKSIEA